MISKQPARPGLHRPRQIPSRVEPDFLFQAMMEIDFRIGRLISGRQDLSAPPFLFQTGKGKFEMLAGSQIVDGEVRTGTIVRAGSVAPDDEVVGLPRDRIGQPEIGKDRMVPHIF